MRNRLLLTILFIALGASALSAQGLICSGIACVIPGATITGSGASQVVALPGALTLGAGLTIAGNQDSATTQVFRTNGTTNAFVLQADQSAAFYNQIRVAAGQTIGFTSTANPLAASYDTKFYRAAAGVMAGCNATSNCDNEMDFGRVDFRLKTVSTVGLLVATVATSAGITTESFASPTSCTGSGCAIQAGSMNSVGTVTTTTTGVATITIAFSITATNGSSCQAQNETTANILKPTSTTTSLVITGTTVAGDKISYQCKFF